MDELERPRRMSRVVGVVPEAIEVYTDGGLVHPDRQDLAIGGFGVWLPNCEVCEGGSSRIG